jgi:hypothetical protein
MWIRDSEQILVGGFEGKRTLGSLRRGWEGDDKMYAT